MQCKGAAASGLMQTAKGLRETLVELRRDFHMHPELAFQEVMTSKKVAEVLDGLAIEVKTGVAKTGVVGLLRGPADGKCVALRADMDALRVREANDVPYRSQTEGIMHACGHDAHTAMCLGAAMLLAERKDQIKGTVKFLFQPAEEGVSGAVAMIRDGAMQDPKVDCVFGLHVNPDIEVGKISILPGPRMATVNSFTITVSGQGGHGGHPCKTNDSVLVSAMIVQAIQNLRREILSFKPYVLSICSIHGGDAHNIIPSQVEMKGTMRTFDADVEAHLKSRLREVAEGVASTFNTQASVSFDHHCPGLANDEEMVKVALGAAEKLGLVPVEKDPSMGGEDFACFSQLAPGGFIRLGAQIEDPPRVGHSTTFDINEDALPFGAALLAQCAIDALG